MNAAGSSFDVLGHGRQIAAYEQAPARPRRPLFTMLAGLLLAAVSAVLCTLLAYDIWYESRVPAESGLFGVSLLFCFYVGGAYLFSYGYELYDVSRAIRLTIVLAVLGVLALAFMVVALVVLAFIKTGAGLAVSEGHGKQALGALSYLGADDDEDGPLKAEPIPGFSMLTCKRCERQFFPVPPDAVCPWCDTAYLSA
jgi:hypothetical protein